MVTGKPSQPTSRDEFEIAIVCTRALEYDAVCLLLDHFWDTDGDTFRRARGDPNTYTTGYMGNCNIVVVLLCNSGKANAAGTAASLRSSYPCIELLLLAGICEGVPDANGEELLLGDVVISETVIQYDLGTQFAAAFREKDTLEDRHGRANKNIRSFTTNIKTEIGYQRLEEKVALYLGQIQKRASETKYQRRRKASTYRYPGSTNDILFESTHSHRHYNSSQCVCADHSSDEGLYAACDESRDMDCEQTGCELSSLKPRDRLYQKNLRENAGDLKSAQIPSIFFGRFGSGDTTFSSGTHRDSLAKKHNIIAFEMEGAGIWDELPCIIVKGVSNYGDGHKAKHCTEWQNFAAATAASVTRALIERYRQTDKSPATEVKLQKNEACMNALRITNPVDDKQRIEDTKGGLLQDAYIWILRNEEFIQWLDNPATRLLWIKGDPGKGKTMLLCGIINELKPESGRNIYYFFCQATDSRLNNAVAILRGLLYLIIRQQPSFISYIAYEYDMLGKLAFEGANAWVVLSRIFEQMLKDDSLKEPIFIIDALDECVADLAQLLKLIVKSSTSFPRVKWLVSSRNEAGVQEALATAENKSTMSLELNAESVSTAIDIYIRHKLMLLSQKKGYKQPATEHLEKYLSDNADGTFLWVALVCARLEKASRFDRLPDTAEFPPGLDQLYERMINRVCDISVSDLGRRVLAIVTVAHRPLTKHELTSLINKNDGNEGRMQPSEYDWEEILGYCGSFLTTRNGSIYFVHQSAKDFLSEQARQRLFPNGTEHIHREILVASLSVMGNTLRKDMYGLADPAFSIDNLSQRAPSDDPLKFIRYGCVYWIDHFDQSILKGQGSIDKSYELVYTFLREKYIYWLEALSLLKRILDVIARMLRLEQLVANTKTPGLLELVGDANRFIQMFGNVIANFPLQVYLSAIIFSPTQSITRQLFGREALEWIQTLPVDETEWAPSLRTYEGSWGIVHLAASCCGGWVASMCHSSIIPIWQTNSGKIIRLLDACVLMESQTNSREQYNDSLHDSCVCFSPWNNEELSSSLFEDNHVIIWDVATGKVLQQLSVEYGYKDISYLTSARNILGCLCEDSLGKKPFASIWNTTTGQMLKKVQSQEHPSAYKLGIFSPTDGSKVARSAAFPVEHVQIFNIDTGSSIHILDGETQEMKFSPNGSLLAVVSKKRTITLSDTTSGVIQRTLRTGANINDLTFSPDGKLLAVATRGGIQVFNITSGECLQEVRIKTSRLIFSSDGSKIFSANNTMINVVKMGQESFIAPDSGDKSHDKHISEAHRVSISPNGRLVASVFTEPLVLTVMDIGSRTSTHVLKDSRPDESESHEIFFSPDSKKLVIISRNMIILWDISIKPARTIFAQKKCGFSGYKKNSTFSSDSERFAITFSPKKFSTSTYQFKVKMWDTHSGKCLMHLGNSGNGRGAYLSISPDSRRLAISWFATRENSNIIRVEIWDVASNSAIQAIDLNYCYLNNHLHISNHGLGSSRLSEEEVQEDDESRRGYIPSRHLILDKKEEINRFSFLGEARLILDVHSDTREQSTAIHTITDLRVVLRTGAELELTGETNNMTHFRESKSSKSYKADSTRTWVEFDGNKLVWIPPQYRNGAKDSHRNCVALSRDDGALFIIQFRHSELAKQASLSKISIMRHMPRSEIQAYTHIREPRNDWKFVHCDMSAPDDKVLDKIDSVAEVKETWSVACREINVLRLSSKEAADFTGCCSCCWLCWWCCAWCCCCSVSEDQKLEC